MFVPQIKFNAPRIAVVAICLSLLCYASYQTLKSAESNSVSKIEIRHQAYGRAGSILERIGHCEYIAIYDQNNRVVNYIHRPDCTYCNKRQQDMNDSICKAIRESK